MNSCPNCLAKNSFKKVHKDGSHLYICVYCDSMIENKPISIKDLVEEEPPQKLFTTTLDRSPEFNDENVTTFNILIIGTFVLLFLIFIFYLITEY
ncbi:hypothetical protein ADM90_15290 [Lysinibacillus macroides]|uniref:Uncharacterized protein n=1 Tax=Lysinibacillus macroides TaxID=33935 RepID=A0A0M9DI03_9BACI|nr:hypothetical protein ADM90_15290 [Lysinibacillus macroides]